MFALTSSNIIQTQGGDASARPRRQRTVSVAIIGCSAAIRFSSYLSRGASCRHGHADQRFDHQFRPQHHHHAPCHARSNVSRRLGYGEKFCDDGECVIVR
jgi:hypothetical protein